MKSPTIRKIRNRGLTPIRYELPGTRGFRHGWVVREGARGAMTIHLIGDDRNRTLTVDESKYVRTI